VQAVSSDGRHVLIADQEDKIVVHRYPNAYNIESFCLAHTGFAAVIEHLFVCL
jgi:hypothetical protein